MNSPASNTAASPSVRRASRRWMLAGLAGSSLCAGVTWAGPLSHWPPALAALAGVGCGGLLMGLLRPARIMGRLHDDARPALRLLNSRLARILDGERDVPLREILTNTQDELGELSRLARDLAAEAVSKRLHARLLYRHMDHSIKRQTQRATAHLERQAATDPLTRLGNRRALQQRLEEFLDDPARCERGLTIMMIDMDLFKEINDALGHEVGDRCLVFLAELLRSTLRHDDCAIRLGGDEFAALLPGTTIPQAQALAGRLISLFAQMPWPRDSVARPTLSVGLASGILNSPKDAADLLRRADSALYSSKQSGRSAITCDGRQRGAA